MNLMLFRGLASRLLLSKRKVKEEPPAVISVTEPTAITAADSGNTYSLDGPIARLDLPSRVTLATGWTINVQCTHAGRYVSVAGAEVGIGIVNFGGDLYDGVQLDSLDASVTLEYNVSQHEVTVNAGTVNGYWD